MNERQRFCHDSTECVCSGQRVAGHRDAADVAILCADQHGALPLLCTSSPPLLPPPSSLLLPLPGPLQMIVHIDRAPHRAVCLCTD